MLFLCSTHCYFNFFKGYSAFTFFYIYLFSLGNYFISKVSYFTLISILFSLLVFNMPFHGFFFLFFSFLISFKIFKHLGTIYWYLKVFSINLCSFIDRLFIFLLFFDVSSYFKFLSLFQLNLWRFVLATNILHVLIVLGFGFLVVRIYSFFIFSYSGHLLLKCKWRIWCCYSINLFDYTRWHVVLP